MCAYRMMKKGSCRLQANEHEPLVILLVLLEQTCVVGKPQLRVNAPSRALHKAGIDIVVQGFHQHIGASGDA